jgi:thiol-disulfide isomerase/thioredoxin
VKNLLSRLLALLGLLLASGVLAGELPYDKSAFEKALAEGKPVIVDFYADWCPTCKTQKPIVQELMHDPKMKEVTLFVADFDKEKDLKKALRVSQQSTFVVFKGGKEVARSTGQTRKADLAAIFAKAL